MWLILFAILAQAGDAYTSCQNLRRGFHELNPLLGDTCSSVIINKSLITTGLYVFFPKKYKLISVGLISGGGIGITVNLINARNKY